MLIGEYEHNLDSKGRVTVPTKFKKDLGECFYVTKGVDGCLFALSGSEWALLEEKIKGMPISKARMLQRFFFSGAIEIELDKQGRILIPSNLRKYANLEKNIIFIGVSNRVEIWNSEAWKAFSEAFSKEEVENAMDLLEL